jgi:hypothetical protein
LDFAGGARFSSTRTSIFDLQHAPGAKLSPWITNCADGTEFGRLCGVPERNISNTPNILNIVINRAPVSTLWAATVAERLGFARDEALSLGKAVAGLTAQA